VADGDGCGGGLRGGLGDAGNEGQGGEGEEGFTHLGCSVMVYTRVVSGACADESI